MHSLWRKLKNNTIKLLLRRPISIIILTIIITVISIFYVLKLKLDTSLISLLPDTYESVRNSKNIIEEIGGIDQFVLLISSPDLNNTLKYAEKLKNEILKLKEIKTAFYSKNMEFFYEHALLYADINKLKKTKIKIKKMISKEKLKRSSFYFDLRENESAKLAKAPDSIDKELDEFVNSIQLTDDKKYNIDKETGTLGMVIMPYGTAADVTTTQKLYSLLNEIINRNYDESVKIEIGGSFKNKIDEYAAIISNAKESAIWVGLSILILLIFYFKNYFSPFVIIIPLLFSISWTFGFTKIAIGGLNVFTLFLFLILFGFGVDIGIIIYARYIDLKKNLTSPALALFYTYKSITAAVFTSVFTTVLAFLLLIFARFKGFSEFGFITAIGVIFAMVAYFLTFPAFMFLMEKINFLRFKLPINLNFVSKALENNFPLKYSKIIFYTTIIITIAFVPLLFKLEFDYDFKNLRPQVKQFEQTRENISKVFSDSFSPGVLFVDSLEEVDSILEYFREKIDTGLVTTVAKLRSIRDIVPLDQEEKLKLMGEFKIILETSIIPHLKKKTDETSISRLKKIELILPHLSLNKQISLNDVPKFYSDKFFNLSKTKYAIYFYPAVQLRDGRNAMKFADELTNLNIKGKRYSVASGNIVLADVLRALLFSGKLAFFLTMLGTFIILLIDFRSFRKAFFVDLPHLVGYIWLGALMFLLGMKLNVYNIISFAILMGMGINPAIYIFHRFIEGKDANLKKSIFSTMVATFITTATTIIGFLGIALTNHGGLHSLGLMTALGMTIFYFITLFIMLPWIHMKLEKK